MYESTVIAVPEITEPKRIFLVSLNPNKKARQHEPVKTADISQNDGVIDLQNHKQPVKRRINTNAITADMKKFNAIFPKKYSTKIVRKTNVNSNPNRRKQSAIPKVVKMNPSK